MEGLVKTLLLNKRSAKLEDLKLFIEEKHPEDKAWFYHLCCDVVEETKKDKASGKWMPTGSGKTGVRSFLEIKDTFYAKYFADIKEQTQRQKLFADWDIKDEETK